MKKFFLHTPHFFSGIFRFAGHVGLVLLITTQLVVAAPYPEKINNNKPFTSVKDFSDLYQKVYKDTNSYELEEIKKRVCEYKDVDCEKTLKLDSFADIVKSVRVETTGEKLSQERFRIFLESKIGFETELLKRERNIDRQSSMALIYSDGDGWDGGYKQKNSPFDITKTLNDLDELFFEEKKDHFSPLFLDREEKGNEAEKWLNQNEDKIASASSYGEKDSSFSGILEHIGMIFSGDINPFSLICTVNTKNLFQYPFCTTPIGIPKLGVATFSLPSATTDSPESESVLDEVFGEEFNPTLLKIMKASECESQDIRKEKDINKTKTSGLDNIEACQRERQQDLVNQIAEFQKRSAQDDIRKEYNGIKKSLENYKGILEFFTDYSDKLIERWKSINLHPKG